MNKLLASTILGCCLCSSITEAAEIDTNTAQMQAMDKITGRVSVINVPVNGDVKFGSFSIVVRSCKTRPPEETPENFAFIDVVDNYNKEQPFNIFRGWMMSSTPGLNAVEHPIYDVWLLKCIDTNVDKSKLLSAVDLKDRDGIAKAPKMVEREKYQVESEVKTPKTVEVVTEAVVKSIDVPVIDEAKPVEEEVPTMAEPVLTPDATPEEDGAPKSLLNMGGLPEERTMDAASDAAAPTPNTLPELIPEPQILAPQALEPVVTDASTTQAEEINFVDESDTIEETPIIDGANPTDTTATPQIEESEVNQLIQFTD